LYRRAVRCGVPGELLLHHGGRGGAALQGSVHWLRLLLLRVPVRRAAISESRQLWLARQDGQMHLLRRRTGSRQQQGRVREIRRQPAGRRQAAAVRRNVLDQVTARRRRRRDRADLQGARFEARVRFGSLGVADRLPRVDCDVMLAGGARISHRRFVSKNTRKQGEDRMAKFFTHMRLIAGALALFFVVAVAAPVSAQQPSSVNQTADAVKEQQLLKELNKIQGRGTIPDVKSYTLEHPAGRDWQHFHNVTLRW